MDNIKKVVDKIANIGREELNNMTSSFLVKTEPDLMNHYESHGVEAVVKNYAYNSDSFHRV